jgi:hypothetical protein
VAKISTGPSPLDWEAYAGDINRATLSMPSEADPVDITGAVVEAQARASASDATVAATATVTLVEPVLGTFTVEWDGEALRTLVAGEEKWTGVWDLQIIETGETLPRTVYRGVFTVIHDVTRAGA